jgi:pimeloyl-ACP methyl ester carboxylesterase
MRKIEMRIHIRAVGSASDLLTSDALALMDGRGTQRFHLVGHDWGGRDLDDALAAASSRIRARHGRGP